MTIYAQARVIHDQLYAAYHAAAAKVASYPADGPMGLTSDATKASPDWKADRKAMDAAFKSLRQFNVWFVGTFKRELAADRKVRAVGLSGAAQ